VEQENHEKLIVDCLERISTANKNDEHYDWNPKELIVHFPLEI
jgi:hypothetical protein